MYFLRYLPIKLEWFTNKFIGSQISGLAPKFYENVSLKLLPKKMPKLII